MLDSSNSSSFVSFNSFQDNADLSVDSTAERSLANRFDHLGAGDVVEFTEDETGLKEVNFDHDPSFDAISDGTNDEFESLNAVHEYRLEDTDDCDIDLGEDSDISGVSRLSDRMTMGHDELVYTSQELWRERFLACKGMGQVSFVVQRVVDLYDAIVSTKTKNSLRSFIIDIHMCNPLDAIAPVVTTPEDESLIARHADEAYESEDEDDEDNGAAELCPLRVDANLLEQHIEQLRGYLGQLEMLLPVARENKKIEQNPEIEISDELMTVLEAMSTVFARLELQVDIFNALVSEVRSWCKTGSVSFNTLFEYLPNPTVRKLPPSIETALKKEVTRACGKVELHRNKIWQGNAKLIYQQMKRKPLGRRVDLQGDLYQEGLMGLQQAIMRYRPWKGERFSTYATWWINNALNKSPVLNFSSVSLSPGLRRKAIALEELKWKQQEMGKILSQKQLAALADCPVENVDALLRAASASKSIDFAIGGEDSGLFLGDTLEDDSVDNELRLEAIATTHRLMKRGARIDKQATEVVAAYYGVGQDKMSYEEIGQTLNIEMESTRKRVHKFIHVLRDIANSERCVSLELSNGKHKR